MNRTVEQKLEELVAALRESDEVQRLAAAQEELENHQAAKVMLRDFAERQQRLQERAAGGEQPSEEELREFEERAQVVSLNPYLRPVLESEYAVSQLVAEVQAQLLIGLGLATPEQFAQEGEGREPGGGRSGELQSGLGKGEGGTDDPGATGAEPGPARERPAKSRLWTPDSGIDPGFPKL